MELDHMTSGGLHTYPGPRGGPAAKPNVILQIGRVTAGEPLSSSPPWEKVLVGKIRAMSATEKSVLLEATCHCIREHSQLIREEAVSGADIRKLLATMHLDLKQPVEQTFLFYLYGLLLRESVCGELVKKHLADLLELSHQLSSQREGTALVIGVTSASHMEVVWATMEHLGRTRFLRSGFVSSDGQQPDPNMHWKWVGSTSLLCYGQMATHAGAQVLPWVDNIVSRMVYYYSCSSYVSPAGSPTAPLWCAGDPGGLPAPPTWPDHPSAHAQDNILKTSFLSAAIMLMKALKWEDGARSYKFTQIPELIHCLLCTLQKEPNFLASLFRQKVILVIVGLSSLRPGLKPVVKSRILHICLESLYKLPPPEMLKTCLPPLELAPDVMVLYRKSMQALDLLLRTFVSENKSMDEVCFLLQHMEPWLESDESYERRRAVQSVFLLLKYVVDHVKFTEEATPSVLGHQIGLLMLLCRDKDAVTRSYSRQCVYLLLQLLIQQKAPLAQALNKNLTVAQHTQLVLTLMHGLCSRDHLHSDLAAELLQMILEDQGIRQEQVAEILQSLFQALPCITFTGTLWIVMKMVTALGAQHTQETVEVMLSLCHPSERQVAPLWKALASNNQLARKVVTLLYVKLKLRPPKPLIRLSECTQLTSLLLRHPPQALGTIYEVLYIQEYKATVRWAFAGILLGLLTQLHYLFELDMAEDIRELQEDILDTKPLSPCRTCLEALKGLFWTTSYWEVFAYLKLLRGWELLEHLETYTEGVTLLARAMAHYGCEIKAVLGQAIISLRSSEERENVAAILIVTEFLNSPELTQHISQKSMGTILRLCMKNPSRLVRAMSLKGLTSIFMCPEKNQLAGLLDSFLVPEPKDLMGLMVILGDILHHLGTQGVGALGLKMAQHLQRLFEDEQEDVRREAIFLYGHVIYSGGRKYQQALKNHAFRSLVPLLFHLADSCPEVVTKAKFTFLRCAILLKWEFRKELFSKLAWGHGLGAENDIFIYMVESSFGSSRQFLMQALAYLRSPHRSLRLAAMKFIGAILQDYFTDVCFSLKKGDVAVLRKQFSALKQEQDADCRRFYRSYVEDVVVLSNYVLAR
ncbi:HEAT repeat-containing protein 7A [Pteropus alecto]|uniref:HEAT repeat-containing protein 7A n=1 Tax=Pteropus alecto TaxID=9402 RepID=L5KJ46_PTEAL|nr:HEAT repeat-containing protein 7A [Pteropus alecto]